MKEYNIYTSGMWLEAERTRGKIRLGVLGAT